MTRNMGGSHKLPPLGLCRSAPAFIPKILDRLFQPFRVDRLLPLVAGFDRLGCLSCPTLFWLPHRFRFVSLIQVYALHRNGGDSRGGSEIKLVPLELN
jgi:hypothetical protein